MHVMIPMYYAGGSGEPFGYLCTISKKTDTNRSKPKYIVNQTNTSVSHVFDSGYTESNLMYMHVYA